MNNKDLIDLALEQGDWEWIKNIQRIANMTQTELLEEEVIRELLPKINTLTRNELMLCLPKLIHILQNSDRYSEDFLIEQFKKLTLKYKEVLLKDSLLNEF